MHHQTLTNLPYLLMSGFKGPVWGYRTRPTATTSHRGWIYSLDRDVTLKRILATLLDWQHMLYCVAENRKDCEIGLRYLLLTFRHFCPNGRIVVYFPEPCDAFKGWLKQVPQAEHIGHFPVGGYGWNCKPHSLLPLLAGGEAEVIWLDSDIMLTRNPDFLFSHLSADTLGVAQEPCSQPHQGSEIRTRGWNLPVGKTLPWTLNSCVIRVTPHHIPLLQRWVDFLNHPNFVSYFDRPIPDRPIHMASDQDVLGALVGSAEFSHIPIHYLRSGVDIIHCGGALGYSFSERVRGLLRPVPTFIHGLGGKPWILFHEQNVPSFSFYTSRRQMLLEISHYMSLCRSYRAELGLSTPWLERRSAFGLLLQALGLGHHALRGLPVVALATVARNLRLIQQNE
uniref:Nucleotide-diphospho-sugar transferase domain-containing protein n=1 Tax=Cyanothece sp. (strain PCC 7425 / ATCC 29141) TaxID=395961 RepID=B8HVY9_CYAP4